MILSSNLKHALSPLVTGLLALTFILPACFAADTPAAASHPTWKFGSEIDALPYTLGGYYASGFVARDAWRFRGVAARSDTPSFLVTDGFKDKRTDAYALIADRFIGSRSHDLQGLWIGGGGEYWRSRIRSNAAPEYARYNNFVLTVGAGYVCKLSRHVYLNPWVGTHFIAAGDRKIQVSGKSYTQPEVTPEASLKIGFVF